MTVTNAWVNFEEDIKGTITPGKLADLTVLSDDPLAMDPFDVRYINIEMTIMDGIIRHNQIDKPRNVIHDAGTFSMGIDDRGLWGSIRSYVGLQYEGIEQIYQGSLLISYDSSTVATATFRQQDYITSPGGWVNFLESGEIANEEATVVYEDASTGHPSSLRVTQETFMWEGDPLLLLKYTFDNAHDRSVSDLYLGQFMVFNITGSGNEWTSYEDDMAGWEENQGLGFAYMYDNDPTAPYIGLAMFDQSGNYTNNALTFTAGHRVNRGGDELRFSKTMRNGIIETEASSPAGYSILMSSGPFSIDAKQSISPFMLAIVVGENLDDLKNAVKLAYQRALLITSIERLQNQIPEQFALFQNFPNPFNPATTIRFSIPKPVFVKLEIFDILGRKVETLIREKYEPGTYTVPFDASRFSSGLYFYQLKAGEYNKVNKMLFLK